MGAKKPEGVLGAHSSRFFIRQGWVEGTLRGDMHLSKDAHQIGALWGRKSASATSILR